MSVKIISDRSAEWASAGLSTRLDLNLLMTFLDIVNAGSITQTALRLHMPKATVSRKLRQLEQQIGAVLLKRGPQRVELTEVGQALFQHCDRIASEVADASNVAAAMQSRLKGAMRISIPFGVGNTWMSQALARFALMYPDLKLTIDVTNRWVDVSEEPYDLAVYIGLPRNEHLPMRRLEEVPRGVYASPEYLERNGVPKTLSDLLHHESIALENQLAEGVWSFVTPNGDTNTVTPRMTSTDILVVHEMVMAGLGLGIFTQTLAAAGERAGRLVRVLPEWRIPAVPVVAMFLERRHMPQRVRTLIDCLAQAIQAQHQQLRAQSK
jgi:DNA-binding transcriptional LysR family regulator